MFIKPQEVIKIFNLEPGMVVADFGCGMGHYSLLAARQVGDGGVVYAIDIQKELLQAVRSRAELEKIKNLQIIWADLDLPNGSKLKDESVDFVILSNILFQSENRAQLIKEAFRILKINGRVGVVEWEPHKKELTLKAGPPPENRISKEDLKNLFVTNGFKLEREFSPGEGHYGLIFLKRE